jgi:4-diphosphocytidyl-2-C-methyl-D-erythritol kinase
MIAFPNAKINIGLQILRKRPDGYHNLETVFYPVNIVDVLEIIEARETSLSLSGIALPEGGDNLCLKAYRLLREDFTLPDFEIHLHKGIPAGGGLGGGSSDAAFLIKLINDYCSLKLSTEAMKGYAARLGADCAFFIENSPQFAQGIGDRLGPVALDLSAYSLVVVTPPVFVSTALAFSGVQPRMEGRQLKKHIGGPIEGWKDRIFNDFEGSVFPEFPLIEQIKQELYARGAVYAAMSGSGSSVFGIFDKAIRLVELEKNYQVFYC